MKGPIMDAKLKDYLKTLPEKEADKTVGNLRLALENVARILETTDINVQDVIMDCLYYQTQKRHGMNPLF